MSLFFAVSAPSPTTTSSDICQSYEWPHDTVGGKTLSARDLATPTMIRLIDCRAYIDGHSIRVIEWRSLDAIKEVPYATVSYVWRGVRQAKQSESFAVEGATDSDRINIEVLHVVCLAAIEGGANYIWLDQLCILQTNELDKSWQIQNMAAIFKGCTKCLVLLGGVGDLIGEGDTSTWITRSWTLQEAMLPQRTDCIVRWTRGPGLISSSVIRNVIENVGGYVVYNLPQLLIHSIHNATFSPLLQTFEATSTEYGPQETLDFSRIFGSSAAEPSALSAALSSSPHLRGFAEEDGIDELETTIWRCAIMRISTMDRDAVFSTMGLFGMQLDPSQYKTKSHALIELLQKSMESGHKATWLAASLIAPGILPLLPTPDASRMPSVKTPLGIFGACVLTERLTWYLSKGPTGSMDDTGALKIITPFSPVKIENIVKGQSGDDSLGFRWEGVMTIRTGEVLSDNDKYEGDTSDSSPEVQAGAVDFQAEICLSGKTGSYAVLLGKIELNRTAAIPRFSFRTNMLVMLVEPSGQRWKKVGMAAVPLGLTKAWEEREVVIFGDDADDLYL